MRKLIAQMMRLLRRHAPLAIETIRGNPRKITRFVVRKSEIVDGGIVFSGRVLLNYVPKEVVFIVRKFREEEITKEFPLTLTRFDEMTWRRRFARLFGLNWYTFEVPIDFPWETLPSSIYGMGYRIDEKSASPQILSSACKILVDDEAPRTFCVFIEPSVRVPRIEMYHFGRRTLAALREQASLSRPQKTKCIVGEYTNTARDNGRALFEWLSENAPDVETVYPIEADNMDNYPTDGDGVVIFGSPQHLSHCIDARVCAFSHHRAYVYPYVVRMISSARYNSTRTIFLQHGIIAMKRSIVKHYHRKRVNYDAFCVSSLAEKRIINRYFDYNKVKVFATGLARYDRLYRMYQTTSAGREQILVFPTWRAGLEKKSMEEVVEDPFFLSWIEAIQKMKAEGMYIVLILHPILQRHAQIFMDVVDEVREATDFQDVLVLSSALVTDYSSVSFDAIFLEKPVFLYQFDQEEMGVREAAFVDIDTELPGPVSMTPDALISDINEARSNNWQFTYHGQRDIYFDHCDDKNSARIETLIHALAMTN